MKKLMLVFTALMMLAGCSSAPDKKENSAPTPAVSPTTADVIAVKVAQSANELPGNRVAVVDFTDIDGGELEEGKILAEQILVKLSEISNLKVVERKKISEVMKEKELSASGITEEEGKELGSLLNVEGIVSGTIVHTGDREEIYARMINARTGEVCCAVNHKRGMNQRKEEFSNLPAEQQARVDREFSRRERMRKENPELYRVMVQHKKELMSVREKRPGTFHQLRKTIASVEKIRRKDPRAFLLITEPKGSPRLKTARRKDPRQFKKVAALRIGLKQIMEHSPSYKKLLALQRERIISKMNAGRKRRRR